MPRLSLMALPSEIRLQIWPHLIPETVELKVPGCYETGEAGASGRVPLPRNPRVPLMLINHQAKEEVSTLPPATLVVIVHDHISLDDWSQNSTLRDRELVSRVRVDSQVIQDLAHESLPRREECADWYIESTLGDELARDFGLVKVLEASLIMTLLDGWLDVTFEVGEMREKRLKGTAGCHSDKVKRAEGRKWEWRGLGSVAKTTG